MKKIIVTLLAALMLFSAIPFSVAAAEPSDLPYVTNNAVSYLSYTGSDDASGTSSSTAKKSFGALRASGAIGMVQKGGTVVISGRGYVSKSYTLPKVGGTLLFTSKYGETNYMNPEPAINPACAFKMAGGAVFTIETNVIFDDIIMFQESEKQTTILVEDGATLVIGSGVKNMTKTGTQMKITVVPGGRLILGGGEFEIDDQGGEIIENYTYNYNKTTQSSTPADEDEEYEKYINVPPAVGFIDYRNGKNSNDGLSAGSAKKALYKVTDNGPNGGVVGIVAGGGTLVTSGIMYVSTDYTFTKLGSPLTITAAYDGVNYIAEDDAGPSAGLIKMATGKTITFETDVRLENIAIYQEGATQNTIRVADGATLTIGEGLQLPTKQNFTVKLQVDAGGTVIFETGENKFDEITGDGMVIMPETVVVKFEASRAYDGRFTDVTSSHWFYDYVKTAYEYGLANGTSGTKFSPDGKFAVSHALTAAANVHMAYTDGKLPAANAGEAWYMPYVNYCITNGIIKADQFNNYDANITRGDMAIVFASILPDSEYEAVKSGSNPDVTADMACYNAVGKLFKAGIVGGDAGTGNYRPNDQIARSEACVIFTRIAAKEFRTK